MDDKREMYFDIKEEINNPYGIRKSKISRSDVTDDFGNLSIYKVEQMLRRGVRLVDLPLIVAFYARVSTDEEVQLHSLSSQIGYYDHMIKTNPNWTFFRGYWDEGISGTSVRRREQFAEMIRDGYEHRFDLIITKEISRFARNTMDSLQYTRELLKRGVGVYFESDGVLTLEPDSEFRLTIMSSVAQEESRKTSERVRRGNRISVENHVVLGSNRIYGFDKEKGKLTINEQEAVMVRMIFELFTAQLYGLRKISRLLYDKGYRSYSGGRISETTIQRILRNPKYKGYYCGGKTTKHRHLSSEVIKIPQENWVMFKDESGEIVPALVSEEVWERAQVLLDKKSQVFAEGGTIVNFKGTYTYSGKIMCEEHRQAYCRSIYRNKRKDGTVNEREVWQCLSYVKQGRKACSKPTLYTEELNLVMTDMVNAIVDNKKMIVEVIKESCEEASKIAGGEGLIQELQNDIELIKKRRDKLLDILLAGRINDTEFDSRNQTMSEEIEAKEQRIMELNMAAKSRTNFSTEGERLCERLESIVSCVGSFSRTVVDTFVDMILVKTESTKEITYLDIYLRNQDYDDPTRFAKSGTGLLMFRDTNQIARRIQEYSSNFSSIFLSPDHWPQQDRSRGPEVDSSISLPNEHWSQQDRTEHLSSEPSIFLPKKVLWWC